MTSFLVCGALVLTLLAPAAVFAQGVAIEHEEIGCIVAGKYPKMNACFAPASAVKKGFVYFRQEASSTWYYVEMVSDAPCFSGVLLRPSKALIGKKIFYYVDVQGDGTGRTPEYGPVVVATEEDCKSQRPVAPLSATGPAAVYPSLPPGFITGGVSTGVVVGGVAAAVVVAGGVKLLGDDNATPSTNPVPTTTNPPATSPTTTVPPTTPTVPPLVVACQAAPRTGQVPLRVDFSTFPSGGTGSYTFAWTFGDGGESPNPSPAHTYTTAGTFNATVLVTSGSQTAACSRAITVTTPPTPPPTAPPAPPKLTVSLTGTGTGTVTGPGINCGTDCNETYPAGTVVTLAATPDSSSTFIGWSGACSGTGPCTLTMTADKSVTAKFEPTPKLVTLTVTVSGPGTVTGTGISCPTDCTESYTSGTPVTLTATPDIFLPAAISFWGWSGDCTGLVPVCALTMTADKTVTAQFGIGPPPTTFLPAFGIAPSPTSRDLGTVVTGVSLSTTLEVPDGEGQVMLNGRMASAVRPGVAAMAVEGRQGANRIEAVLVRGSGRPGTWRFELSGQAALEAGSLRVVAGTVALITGDAVVFRLEGKSGERVVFTFEVED